MPITSRPSQATSTASRHWSAPCLTVALLLSTGCSTVASLSPVPCSRVALEPAPPWTASAAWRGGEGELVLVDPGSHSLATYGRDGQRLNEVTLEAAELDYSEPMRFEPTEDGYVLIDRTQVVQLDDTLALSQLERPFEPLQGDGFTGGSFNDALLHHGRLYGYADFIEPGESVAGAPEADPIWRRGFVRLDRSRSELDLVHELPIESADGEYANYYLYDRRPYLSELGGEVYVLRFTEPWTVHRFTRRGLREIAVAISGDEDRAHALQAWQGHLYVLTSHVVPDPDAEPMATTPTPLTTGRTAHMELQRAQPALATGHRHWFLYEIDPQDGTQRRLRLPTSAERIRLLPGRHYWTAIEESSSPNLGQGDDRTTFLYLPSTEILAGRFSCSIES